MLVPFSNCLMEKVEHERVIKHYESFIEDEQLNIIMEELKARDQATGCGIPKVLGAAWEIKNNTDFRASVDWVYVICEPASADDCR